MAVVASKFQVLSATHQRESSIWNELVDQAPMPDVYYRPGYARTIEAAGHGKAIALLINGPNTQVLMPLLLRPLSDLPFAAGETGFDAITPYGYGGLLPLSEIQRPSATEVHAILDALRQWCLETGVASCLIRLHPFLFQDHWVGPEEGCSQGRVLSCRAVTFAVDLTRWDREHQRIAGMRTDRRSSLNRARCCLEVTWSERDVSLAESLSVFRDIYEQRMAQLNANSYYLFPTRYYLSVVANLTDHLGVALAWRDGRPVAASLFLAERQFANYHLSGSTDEGRRSGAPTLLINAGAEWASERGCRLLHLGGAANDAHGLYNFKSSFGGPTYHYYTLDVIADEPKYQWLTEERTKFQLLPLMRDGFFPRYRA